jgi:hypothetical protein
VETTNKKTIVALIGTGLFVIVLILALEFLPLMLTSMAENSNQGSEALSGSANEVSPTGKESDPGSMGTGSGVAGEPAAPADANANAAANELLIQEELATNWNSDVSYGYTMELYNNMTKGNRVPGSPAETPGGWGIITPGSETALALEPGSGVDPAAVVDTLMFSVRYPQLYSTGLANEDEVNQAIRNRAMLTVEMYYLNPSESMQEYLNEYRSLNGKCELYSDVDSYILYNDNKLVSIVFKNHYFIANIYGEFNDLMAININMLTGEVYSSTSNLIVANNQFCDEFSKKSADQGNSDQAKRVLSSLGSDQLALIFAADPAVSNRYFSDMFVDKYGNVCISLTYHNNQNGNIDRGWLTVAYLYAELTDVKSESSFWDIVPGSVAPSDKQRLKSKEGY